MSCTIVVSSGWSGVVQIRVVIVGRYSSLYIGGRLVGEDGGETPLARSIMTGIGVVVFRSGSLAVSSSDGGLGGVEV